MLKKIDCSPHQADLKDPASFLDQLPSNKQIKNFIIARNSPLKSRVKTNSEKDISIDNDITLEDLIQFKKREKQKNSEQSLTNKFEFNHQLDILNNSKNSRKTSQKSILLPKIEDRRNSRNLYLDAYSNEEKIYKEGKKKHQRSVSFLDKNKEKIQIQVNQILSANKQNQSFDINGQDLDIQYGQLNQISTKSTNSANRSPSRKRKVINQQELQDAIQKQAQIISRKWDLDDQLTEQVVKLKKKMEEERILEKIVLNTYEKENKDNEERKIKLKLLQKQTQSTQREQMNERMQKYKEMYEKQKLEQSQQILSKKEEENKITSEMVEKKQALQQHYKELAKQILNKQFHSHRNSIVNVDEQNQQSFNDKICIQDQNRVKNRSTSSYKLQIFLKSQQREQKQQIFLDYKNMYENV